jgi:hypothetical protein
MPDRGSSMRSVTLTEDEEEESMVVPKIKLKSHSNHESLQYKAVKGRPSLKLC